MQMGFFFDQSRCSGCLACVTSCQAWHTTSQTLMNFRRVFTSETGAFPDPKVSLLSLSCCHCVKPACADVCPTNAIVKGKTDGVVTIDPARCLGRDKCGKCRTACPWDIPQFSGGPGAPMQKCDFCRERLAKGEAPICVMACPLEALDFGPIGELKKRHPGSVHCADGFAYNKRRGPCVFFKVRRFGNSPR